ncbi:Ig-like domain-containing protein [Cohnella nanjingensis]|nr:Ig-like domain-containing protein [Cohnella nanjingensis]
MGKRFWAAVLLLTLGLGWFPAPSGYAQEETGKAFYVATDGSDYNTGGINDPFRTLEAARNAIRVLKEGEGLPAGGVTVYIREGTYPRSESFELTEADSGTADSPIVYRAYPGETVQLSGGANLDRTGFQPVDDPDVLKRIIDPAARGKVVQFDLAAAGLADYGQISRHGYWKASDISLLAPMQLYIGGQGMTLARWPNAGTVQMGDIVDPGPTVNDPDLQTRGGTFKYAYDRPLFWKQADEIWLDGIFGYSWEWSYNKIASIDTDKKTITLQYGEMSGIQKNWYPDFHFAENLLEEIDAPGEYYIDRAKGLLYLFPNADFRTGNGEITVTTLNKPMIATNGASYIRFEELQLAYGRDTAAVLIGGSHVTISHCDISNFAGGAVFVNVPSKAMEPVADNLLNGHDHLIDSTHIHHIGALAVTLNGGNAATLEPGNNRVANSHIHDFAFYNKAYNPGVVLRGVGNQAVGNEIHDAPHPGILIFGNDHLVEYNNIYDVCKLFSDLGAIYMNAGATPQERGTVVRRNYFHHIGENKPGVEGVYPDNLTMGLTIEQNVFYKMGNAAIKNNAGAYIKATNNLFIDAYVPFDNQEMFLGDAPGNKIDEAYMPQWKKLFQDNGDFIGTPYLAKYPELARFFQENRYYPDTNDFQNNVVYNPTLQHSSEVNAQGARDVLNLLNSAGNWVTDQDPGFENLAAGDLRLRKDAAVFSRIPGFVDIPFEQIGTQGKVGVTHAPDAVQLTGLAFPYAKITIELGQTLPVRAAPIPWNADLGAVTYESSDPAIAKVDGNGGIQALAPGVAVIRAQSAANPALSDELEVTVTDEILEPVTGIELSPAALTLEPGERSPLAATVLPPAASNKNVKWMSSNPKVAIVDQAGLVTALKPGSATLTAVSAENDKIKAQSTVTVRAWPNYPVQTLNKAIKDQKGWTKSDAVDFRKGNVRIAGQGVFGYEAQKFGSALLKFNAKFGAYDGGWYGFALRSDRTGDPTWVNGNKGYLIVIKEDQIEFQAWKPGQKMVRIIPNDAFQGGREYEIEIGVIRSAGGERFILKSGSRVILNEWDADANNPIAAEGYFNVYNYGGKTGAIELIPAKNK